MGTSATWVTGGFQTDVATNWARAGHGFAELVEPVVTGTLEAGGVDPADIGVIHVGNAFDAYKQVTDQAGEV